MFVVSISANAQTQDPKEAGKIDAKNLSEYVVLTQDQQNQLAMYFAIKHDAYQSTNLSEGRKDAVKQSTMANLTHILTPAQMTKLESNPTLLKSLTGVATTTKK